MAHTTMLLAAATTPMMVNTQPLPMAWINGAATTPPMAEKMLRTKLLTATPEEAFFGMNSVSMVVAMAKMSIEPTPKMKVATIWMLLH
jgi:hypothetical protein